ncbi:MAG: metalloregulator ArsR/SmtB family transcription factor [Candidatus Paceibacterota bacterium]
MSKDNVYKAFSNEQRLNLLNCLSRPQNVGDLMGHCTLTQSALSQHLKVLRDAGVVKTCRDGKEVVYCVKSKKVTQITKLLLNLK